MKQGISIIIPNYNNGEHIEKCLDSIKSQTFKNWEVIFVDDVSTDDSVKILKRYQKKNPDFPCTLIQKKKKKWGGCNFMISFLLLIAMITLKKTFWNVFFNVCKRIKAMLQCVIYLFVIRKGLEKAMLEV